MNIWAKVGIGVVVVYILIVVLFESLLGYYQPQNEGTIVITTTQDDGEKHSRVVSRLESGGNLYVAANHWPRIWYYDALENPELVVEMDGVTADYTAVPVEGEEHDRVNADKPLPLFFRILTGFPPRYFIRLDPREGG